MSKYQKSLFIFRRDLRLDDNTALIAALGQSDFVIPAFIFDPRQVEKNSFRSDNCLQFMIESLKDLDKQLRNRGARLFIFYGRADSIVNQLIREVKLEAVFVNRDYTPFSIHRDLQIEDACRKQKIDFKQYGDSLLNEPEVIRKKDGGVYTVFTPFANKARQIPVKAPQTVRVKNFYTKSINGNDEKILGRILPEYNRRLTVLPGRRAALKILSSIHKFEDYKNQRDIPSLSATTGLSVHHKFGTVSIREVYHAVAGKLGPEHPLINEIYWRDFFTHVGYHYPQVLGQSFREKYHELRWNSSSKDFKKWCSGQTGFPIVDAGMRELNTTGFMHNRVRMIVASFLVKDLHLNWQWGEKYFAQKLVDYDPFVNNGNWQWAASTGCDAQPYFRIFNPWRQQARFDPKCIYIKRWIPELSSLKDKEIHNWFNVNHAKSVEYPVPMVDHQVQSRKAKEMFKR